MVSPGARLVRVEHVGRVEGGSFEQITTRPLVWNFSTFQPFNTSTYYYTHDMRPRRRRRVARRSVATEPRSGRKSELSLEDDVPGELHCVNAYVLVQ